MREILDALSERIFLLDRDLKVEFANRAMLESARVSRNDAEGKPCGEFRKVCSLCLREGSCPAEKVLVTGSPVTRVFDHLTDECWEKTYEANFTPVVDDGGRTKKVLCVITDISERAKSERILRRYSEGLAILYEISSLFLKSSGANGSLKDSILMIGEYYGTDLTQVFLSEPGGDVKELLAGGDMEGGFLVRPAAIPPPEEQAGFTYHETCPAIINDYGREKRFRKSALYEEHGILSAVSVPMMAGDNIVGVMCLLYKAAQDIDTAELWYLNVVANALAVNIEKERLIEKLGKSESFVSSVLEGIGEGVIVVGKDFRIISANSSYLKRLNIAQEGAVGEFCYKLSHQIDRPCYENGEECSVKRVFETGGHHSALHTHYDKDGRAIYVETNAYPMVDSEGNLTAAVETIVDVTERVKLKMDLENRIKELEEFYEMAVGRELRMIELKEEIEALRSEAKRSGSL